MASQQKSWWEKTRSGGKAGFDKIYNLVDKLGAPVNKLTNKLGSEAFWPTTLDKESDKAARILRSFCKDGFYQEEKIASSDGPTAKQRVLKKIPSEVIKNAKGLAIFTTMRTGLWVSGAGGSGILVGRTADGSWSPPSGIMLHTAGLGFLVGVDIYDCVIVINTQKALDAFSKIRCTVGGELSAVAGPVGAGGILETEVHKRQAPVFTYMKSRGFYAGVQIDGTVIIERTDENERFYNERLPVGDILAGKVRHPPYECRGLLETIKAAQGDSDVDSSLLPSEPPPGDYVIEDNGHVFGIPDKEDPDPYGVLALEKEGMSIREAGTHKRASWEQFAFQPSPTSPIYSTFSRLSMDQDGNRTSKTSRSSWQTTSQTLDSTATRPTSSPVVRGQPLSRKMTDGSTQTDDALDEPQSGRSSARGSVLSGKRGSMDGIPENSVLPASPTEKSKSRSNSPPQHRPVKPVLPPRNVEADADADEGFDAEGEDTADDADVIIEEPVFHSVQKATTPTFKSKVRMVEVPKRIAPQLPPRNPNRRGPIVINAEPGAERNSEDGSSSPTVHSPSLSVKTSDVETPSSASPPPPKDGFPKDEASEKFEEIEMGETPDELSGERNPWDKIMEKHNKSQESLDVPGAFHSLPATPGESNEGHKE